MDLVSGPHVPTLVSPEDFERGHLKPQSYTQEALSNAIVANANRGFDATLKNCSARQISAFNRFLHTGSWSISQPGHIDNLKKFFDIFDDAYFGGLLKGYCTLELVKEAKLSWFRNIDSEGLCESYVPGCERDPRLSLENRLLILSSRVISTMGSADSAGLSIISLNTSTL
jgi:hypothetical protein